MTLLAIDQGVQHLHQWGWKPGKWMHEGWWSHLGLAPWRAVYHSRPACRPSIDRLILRHRGITWTSLPAGLDARQRAMLALEPRWPQLVIALGVVALNCPDHLLLKDHRQALAPYLDERHCEQLLALHRGWSHTEPALPAEALSQAALHAGTRWWLRDVEPAPLSDLLSLRLPPVADALLSVRENAIHCLIKLGRFL
ncbi:type III secretion system domain-containing protein [Pseudomonas chlororaphis subsp. piscium]